MASDDERVRFVTFDEAHGAADRLYARLVASLSPVLPRARFEHVGATAVPGLLTKGDLDVQIIVAAEDFESAKAELVSCFELNEGGFAGPESASFQDDDLDPPLGAHLIVANSEDDIQWRIREVLLARADLVADMNRMKTAFHGGSMEAYRNAKANFLWALRSEPEYPREGL